MAADWTIRQGSTITTIEADLQQGNSSLVSESTQAINGIALETDADDVAAGSVQSVRLTTTLPFRMLQGAHVDQANQALNYIEAQNIGGIAGAEPVVQSVTTPAQETSLTQIVSGTGNQNLQAMNAAEATGAVRKVEQTSTVRGSLKLFQDSVSTTKNTQAVNYASGQSIGHQAISPVEQEVTNTAADDVVDATRFSQTADGGQNVQAGNIAIATTSGINAAIQTFGAAALELNQDVGGGGSNIQAVNYARTGTIGTGNIPTGTGNIQGLTQTVTVTGVTEFKNDSGSPNNVQAGNLADSAGDITDLEQRFTASASSFLRFTQEGSGNSNIQAGNMARINGDSVMNDINQHFTGSSNTNAFRQTTTADNLIQAANLLDVATGSLIDNTGPHQNFAVTTASLTMVQNSGSATTGATSNLQALNAMVDRTTGNVSSQVHQSLNVHGLNFQMEQNGVANSGQFGNFAGVRL